MPTTQANTLLFFVDKMWESFAMQRILTFFQQKITLHVFVILPFNDIIDFEQLAPVKYIVY